MEGYFGNNSNFNHAVPPLNLSNDNISLYASPRDYDPVARVRHYDDSMMLRYLLSGSSSSDENTTPRNRPAAINSDQLRRLSSSSSGGCSSQRVSPLSTLKNVEKLPLRRSELASSAVKIEEDVLVMDAIPVRSAVRAGGSRSGRMKSPLSMSSDSGALPSSSPVTGYSGFRKRELCRSWEDLGTCRDGNKCVFAHGKEELDPRIFSKAKSVFPYGKEEINPPMISMENIQINMFRAPSNPPLKYGQNYSSTDKARTKSNLKGEGSSSQSAGVNPTKKQEQNQESNSSSVKFQDWSPLDDGIELTLPNSTVNPLTREAFEEIFNRILHGPSEKKRLPVFEEICPKGSHAST